MTLPGQPRRRWFAHWMVGQSANCPHCKIPCVAQHTETTANGRTMQYRKCPDCGHTLKTPVPVGAK